MRTEPTTTERRPRLIAALACALVLFAGCGGKPEEAAPAKKSSRAAGQPEDTGPATNNPAQILAVKSVFATDQAPDPFFPALSKKEREKAATGQPKAAAPDQSTPATALHVRQILAVGDRRVALVNDAVLEPGRSASVTLASGQKWRVLCVEVGTDSVTVRVEGQGNREVKLPAPGRSSR